jgi:hypothetical protein
VDRRLAAVDAYQFPAAVRQRFALAHETLTGDEVALVEAATRQFFRLAARHPKDTPAMPSVVVDHLWHEFSLHTHEYAEFCGAAIGRILPYGPAPDWALPSTLRLAQADEGCAPTRLPLLFRVDREVKAEGGRRYLADCGGRGICYELRGTVCLQHINGMERVRRERGTGTPYESDSGFYFAGSGDT